MAEDEQVKYPYRNLGERVQVESAPELSQQAQAARLPQVGIQQSVFQSPVENKLRAELDPEILARAEKHKLVIAEAMRRLAKKHRHQRVVGALVLGVAGLVFASPVTHNLWFPALAGVLGVVSGICIGHYHIDNFWSKFVHAVPQMIWGIIGLLYGWQAGGFSLMIISGTWALHFIIAGMVGMKFELEEKSV